MTKQFSQEYEGAGVNVSEDSLPKGVASRGAERKTYTMKDGSQGSRSAYIKELFTEEKLSRTEISEQYNFSYRDVYTATVNMTNGTETGGRGRAQVSSVVKVTKDGHQLLTEKGSGDDTTFTLNGEEITAAQAAALTIEEMARNVWIKEQVEAGVDRGKLAKWLDLSYGVIYGVTKEMEGTRAKTEYDLTDADGSVRKVSRAAYIRHMFMNGKTRGEIVKELGVAYQVVWQATKEEKEAPTAAEQFAALITEIAGFADKVEDRHSKNLNKIIEALRAIELKAPAEEVANTSTDEAAE